MAIEQKQDSYSWRVYYGSGWLDEEHAQATFASVITGCTDLALLNQEGAPTHLVHIPDGAEPVFFRRRQITLNPTTDKASGLSTTHCIGWKRGEDAVYLFVFEDGSQLLTDDLQAV